MDAYVPEKTGSYELGIRWTNGKQVSLDVSCFRSNTKNVVAYNFGFIPPDSPFDLKRPTVGVGYFNAGEAEVQLSGIQSLFQWKNMVSAAKMDLSLSANIFWGHETLPFSADVIDEVRGQPSFEGQAQLSFNPFRNLYVHFFSTYFSDWKSRKTSLATLSSAGLTVNDQIENTDGYFVLDMMARVRVSSNFQAYLQVNNVFNQQYAGISTDHPAEGLQYNPQPLRHLKVGMSYRLE